MSDLHSSFGRRIRRGVARFRQTTSGYLTGHSLYWKKQCRKRKGCLCRSPCLLQRGKCYPRDNHTAWRLGCLWRWVDLFQDDKDDKHLLHDHLKLFGMLQQLAWLRDLAWYSLVYVVHVKTRAKKKGKENAQGNCTALKLQSAGYVTVPTVLMQQRREYGVHTWDCLYASYRKKLMLFFLLVSEYKVEHDWHV